MARILGIGVATRDVALTVAEYPREDDKVRAVDRRILRGGNAANTLEVLSRLGHRCAWAGVTSCDDDGQWVLRELRNCGVDTSTSVAAAGGSCPTSYVLLSKASGTRSIVHYRNLREYTFADFVMLELAEYDWLHFEGRNVADTRRMLEHARDTVPYVRRSVEMEKARANIETLAPLAHVLLFSRAFACERGHTTASSFLLELADAGLPADLICTWGAEGAFAVNAVGEVVHSPAFAPSRVVDTRGAGDTFNAGFIDARLRGSGLEESLRAACRLAGSKCAICGLAIDQRAIAQAD